MKKIIITLMIACFLMAGVSAQDVSVQFDEARTAYKAGDLQHARFALQQALYEIDYAIGQEVLKILPNSLGSMVSTETEGELTTTNLGIAGLSVNRTYKGESEKHGSIQLLGDSPLLAGINAILSIPLIGGGDPNQKRIKVGNYKGLLQKSTSETGVMAWDVQIPFGSSLLTFHCEGFNEEKVVMDMANTIPVDKIAKLIQ